MLQLDLQLQPIVGGAQETFGALWIDRKQKTVS